MAFEEVQDAALRRSLQRNDQAQADTIPFGTFTYVEVVFPVADQDTVVPHTLNPSLAESVRYAVIRQSGNAVIYQDLSASRTAWQSTFIILRASVPTTARLLLFQEHDTSVVAFTTGAAATNRIIPTGLKIPDTSAAFFLSLVEGSSFTANRTFTLTTGDASRTLTLSGNPTLADWFDQSVKTTATPTFGNTTVGTLAGSNVVITTAADGVMVLKYTGAGDPSTNLAFYRGATVQGSVTCTAGTTTYNTTSDHRLKTFIEPLDPMEGLDVVEALRPITFEMVGHPGVDHTGFLADEVEQEVPEAVSVCAVPTEHPLTGEVFCPLQLDQSRLIPFLVAAVQALSERLRSLESR